MVVTERRSPTACRWSRPRSVVCRRPWVTGRRGPAGAARAARRPGRARRRAAGLAGRRRPARTATPRGGRAARVALRVVDHRVRRLWRPAGGGGMTVEQIRVSSEWLELREPADAAARRARPGRARPAAAADQRPPGDPRPRLRQRIDGPVARAAPAGAAALGHARPRRGPAGDRRRRPSRPGRRRGPVVVETRLSDITELRPDDLAGATLITRLGAARPDDGRSSWPTWPTSAPRLDARCC